MVIFIDESILMRKYIRRLVVILTTSFVFTVYGSTPVVLKGDDLPYLVGKPIASIRALNTAGNAVPFQIDAITASGEYVLDKGEIPNTIDGHATLEKQDEIVFLWDDADKYVGNSAANSYTRNITDSAFGLVMISRGRGNKDTRAIIIRADSSLPLSPVRYIEYDHGAQRVATEYYYANFAKDRFHFTSAGVKNFDAKQYINLTNELRVEIFLKTLFGLIPIRYSENNIVCFVRRYKLGPIRLIRRGDFHLNLGLGVKGSRAAVNQICYSQIVNVPVYIHLPIRFRTLFGQAHIEMTPVVRERSGIFKFSVPAENIIFPIYGDNIDTLIAAIPTDKTFALCDGVTGYGWRLSTTMEAVYLGGSGFIMRRPSPNRAGVAECGFRLAVRDVPKGNYYITNRIVFSGGVDGDIEKLGNSVDLPITVNLSRSMTSVNSGKN